MDGYEVKRVMDQIHISEKMQEDIVMNMQSRVESGKKRTWNIRRMAATAAAFALTAGLASFPVRAFVGAVQERMERVPKAQMEELNNMVQSQHDVQADGFSREYSDSEKGRSKALWQAYENGTFPEGAITQVESPEAAPEGKLCYIEATGVFNLPAQEMTDEEMLEIIDFQHKMAHAVAESPQAQAARAESEEKDDRLKKALEDAGGGISVSEAVEMAKRQLKADIGGEADELELLMYENGVPGVCLLDAADYEGVAFTGESKAGVVYDVGFGNPKTHVVYGYIMDAVDGNILYTYK